MKELMEISKESPLLVGGALYNRGMKIELDHIRGYYAELLGSIFKGIGVGDKVAKAVVAAWVECDRPLTVLWGPPGSGKSTVLDSMDSEGTMVFETTGLNRSINKFLLNLPQDRVTYVRHMAPASVCKKRLAKRKNNRLGSGLPEHIEYLQGMVTKWYKTAKNNLPVHRETV